MKKMFTLLLAAMMLLAMMPAAMAYTAATFTGDVVHTLSLTDSTLNAIPYDITYTFTNDGGVDVNFPGQNFQSSYVATINSPSIAAITYEAGSTPTDQAAKTYTQTLTINWSNVTLTEPGIYRWKFKQTESSDDPVKTNISNNMPEFYLYAYVTISGDNTLVAAVRLYNEEGTFAKNGFGETYPAQSLSLTLSKRVDGNQASRNQYFPFTIALQSPNSAANMVYTINYANAETSVPATAYNEAVPAQTSQIEVNAGQTGSAIVWLKHGQSISIDGLLYNTTYTITESANEGYAVTGTITEEGTAPTSFSGDEATDTLTKSSTVAYTNYKNATVPTGIELETAAPIVGMILAMTMLALLFVGKRKEEIA